MYNQESEVPLAGSVSRDETLDLQVMSSSLTLDEEISLKKCLAAGVFLFPSRFGD